MYGLFIEVNMEIVLLVGLVCAFIASGVIVTYRRSSGRYTLKGEYRQFYTDGLMTQEIEALKIETTQPNH